ncbi:TRAP transporter small permease subunit [Ruegeria sp. HKCCD8929]|uniref:TRAP transporter small permease subunit n=1 Tax=Ruegeria sp. HKCCD8929 TaxID=2683006 RepID=UPI00148907F8|nr:TRAP transporter small permease subunit [Ruegeria sp. HKCCD8929]
MDLALGASRAIDRFLWSVAKIGAWCAVLLVAVVTYDVFTRYLGVPKVFGLTSTMLQESEYWLHSFLIVLVVGYAYTRQSHVRIDLIRENLSERAKYIIEIAGILLALIPYAMLGVWLSWPYVVRSYTSGEISKSQTGLTDLWILKSGLIILFVLIGLAGISQLIKSIAGLAGRLPGDLKPTTIGGEH